MTNLKRQVAGLAAALLLAGCSSSSEPQHPASAPAGSSAANTSSGAAAAGARRAARSMAERFGKRMQQISVLAPPDAVRAELPKAYGGLLSPELQKDWQANPDRIIGREGSSPWPDRIAVKQVDCDTDTACRVAGDVDYMTSNEVAHGGVFMRRAITLELADTARGWRITAVHLEAARD